MLTIEVTCPQCGTLWLRSTSSDMAHQPKPYCSEKCEEEADHPTPQKCENCDGLGTLPANDDTGLPPMKCPKCHSVDYRPSPPAEPKCEPNPILSCVCSRGTKCCPIDHRPPAEPKCGGLSHSGRCDDPKNAYRPPTTEPAESEGKDECEPMPMLKCRCMRGTNGCMKQHPAPSPPGETEDAKALEDRAKHFWREETYAEELPHKRLARFAQAEIELQTPAIIDAFVEEVEELVGVAKVDPIAHAIFEAMQTVKARREGGKGK